MVSISLFDNEKLLLEICLGNKKFTFGEILKSLQW